MSYLLSNTNPMDRPVEINNDQKPWVRGATRGAPYMIHPKAQAEIAQKLVDSTMAAKKKTDRWISEARTTKTDIDIEGILKDLQWTTKDMAEVAVQSHQLPIVNLQRANNIRQMHCCSIIREVTKKVISSTIELASQKINPSDPFQANELTRLGEISLSKYSTSHNKNCRWNIDHEEKKSEKLRQDLLEDLSLLLKSPSRYKALAIKENTMKNIESEYQELRYSDGVTTEIGLEIDKIRNRAMDAINALQITTPEEMHTECEAIVAQVNQATSSIFTSICLHSQKMNSHCSNSGAA